MNRKEFEEKKLRFPKQPDWEYFEVLRKSKIQLVILGLDPFPKGATGIPFHKETWKELIGNPSFEAIADGLDLEADIEKFKTHSPKAFFYYLAREKGVAFLNVCYNYYNGKITKKDCSDDLQLSFQFNKEILEMAKGKIICCGKKVSKCLDWVTDKPTITINRNFKNPYPYHPACRGKDRSSIHFTNYWNKGKIWKLLK